MVWGSLLVGPIPVTVPGAREEAGTPEVPDADDEETAASSIGLAPVTLTVHHDAVGRRAQQIAEALQLPGDLRETVVDAGRWHDLGKVDRRFQVMLHGGDPYEAALAPEPLAKSGMDPADRLAWRRAARVSGLPGGARHEAWSAALVEEHLRTRGTPYPGDVDLLLHLVASHHGHARPLLPPVIDGNPAPVEAVVDGEKVTVPSEVTVSLDHPARFARLNERYGRWGLALLEAVVRCADMTVSGEGS
jgi:CRISPR-associated endonuclease/helicase Cas3